MQTQSIMVTILRRIFFLEIVPFICIFGISFLFMPMDSMRTLTIVFLEVALHAIYFFVFAIKGLTTLVERILNAIMDSKPRAKRETEAN
ncbi:hypothetical protein KSD_90150 [Ktedonobacter sp. SOSP1-85]|nr:hypothetical protein KSD_90150 [Ktedonobacter sp. SOSP1-85]